MRRLTLALALLLALAACGGDDPLAPSTSLKPSGASTSEALGDTVYAAPSPAPAENDSTYAAPSSQSPTDGRGIMIGGGN